VSQDGPSTAPATPPVSADPPRVKHEPPVAPGSAGAGDGDGATAQGKAEP
jgi:hypothetical protein